MKGVLKFEKILLSNLLVSWCRDHVFNVLDTQIDKEGVTVVTDYGSIYGTRNNRYLVFGSGRLLSLGLLASGEDFSEVLDKMNIWFEANAKKLKK